MTERKVAQPRRLAIYCRYLRRTIDPARNDTDHIVAMCTHVIRDGSDCVGPFLEDLPTDCQLWEPRPLDHYRLPPT
jgi:hypothetical protein